MQQDLQEHQRRAKRIETLLEDIATYPDPEMRATTEELIQILLDMYGEGLARILELTAQTKASGESLIGAFVRDELLASLFLLHDLHPSDIKTRLLRALDDVRPYLKSQGGGVELVSVEDGVAHLRLSGSCQGCFASTNALRDAIEEAITGAAPDLDRIEVEDAEQPHGAVKPLMYMPRKPKANALPVMQDGVTI